METKIPTLEEVKEYFKNAKEVKCLCNSEIYSTKPMINDFYYNEYTGWWFDILLFENTIMDVLVWNEEKNMFAEIISYKDETSENIGHFKTPKHYDNSKGTLYKVATERNWNPYLFDVVKRLERAEKKGEFKTDLEKSINVIKLWLKEYGN